MSNPNPQHNPTDGLGVAAYVTLSGSSGSSVIENTSGGANKTDGGNGQGIGAGTAASGTKPVAQYSLTLSVAAAGGFASSLAVTAALKDVANSAYSPVGNIVTKSYSNPSAGSPAWYNPSNFTGYTADVASVTESTVSAGNEVFTITALAPGQAIIECQFPTFDNTDGDDTNTGNPRDMIYVQVVVTVIP
jgi:hypothetical protein